MPRTSLNNTASFKKFSAINLALNGSPGIKTTFALRRKNDTLVYGDFRLIEEENPDIFAYERNLGEKKLIVLCNFRDTAAEMKARYDLTKGTVLIHNDTESLTKEVWKLQPYEAYMIELLQ